MTKLLVASGWIKKKSVEIVNLDEENPDLICDNLPELPTGVHCATGQLLGEMPIICGGTGNLCNCQFFQNGSWKITPNSNECRTSGASATLTNSDGKDVLFIAGGIHGSTLQTAKTFDGSVWNHQQNSPEPSTYSCIVKLNSSTIFHIGGRNKDDISIKNTYFYNMLIGEWIIGPILNIGRNAMSCGILKWENPEMNQMEKVVVVAGGLTHHYYKDKQFMSSVELLYLNDDNSVKGDWMMGPELPNSTYGSNMIEYNNSVIMFGGEHTKRKLYKLSSPKGPWIEMKQKLKEERSHHVSFLVPDELVNCHN